MIIKEIILLPIFITLTLGLGMQLADLANDVSAKTVDFSNDATAAVDCAFKGENIADCSPELVNYDFTPEIKRLNDISEQLNVTLFEDQEFSMYYQGKIVRFRVQEINGQLVLIDTDSSISTDQSNEIVGNFISTKHISGFFLDKNKQKHVDLDQNGIYDIIIEREMQSGSDSLKISLSKKPTMIFFFSSNLVLFSLLGLFIYFAIAVNSRQKTKLKQMRNNDKK